MLIIRTRDNENNRSKRNTHTYTHTHTHTHTHTRKHLIKVILYENDVKLLNLRDVLYRSICDMFEV